jgi:GNAT superfamily N-acetyltransferase
MPTRPAALPEGLTTRPLEKADAPAVFRLMAAQEQEDIGHVAIEEADIVSDWAKPSHDLGARSVGVLDGDTLVAYAELMGADRADTSVLPSHRGRGIGTWLAHWLIDLGRSVGSSVVGMPVPQGSPGDRLLEELGFRVRWTSWVLKLPEGATIPERALPDGYVVRTAAPDELRAAHDVLEDAFLEWSVRDREPFEDFAAATTDRPGFEPWSASRWCSCPTTARRRTSTGWRCAATSATAGSPRRCSSTRSPAAASTALAPPSSAPTHAPEPCRCTSGWAWSWTTCGSTAPWTSPEPPNAQNHA